MSGIHTALYILKGAEKIAHTAFHDWNSEFGCKLEKLHVLNAQEIYI